MRGDRGFRGAVGRLLLLAGVATGATGVMIGMAAPGPVGAQTPLPGPVGAPGPDAAPTPDTAPAVVLITGSTDGLGREVALRLGALGSHVIIHGRNVERGEEVVREIEAGGVGSARFYRADLASLAEVHALADAVLRDYERLDALVNNAGLGSNAPERELTGDGHEMRFQVNYLSHFLLTERLLPLLVRSAPARIVHVASSAQTSIDFEDVAMEDGYSGQRAYGQSKLAQILHTFDLAAALEGTGVTANALHPATFMDTRMVLSAGRTPLSTVEEGADAVLRLLLDPETGSGQYFNQTRPAEANGQAYDPEARALLRALSLEWTGID